MFSHRKQFQFDDYCGDLTLALDPGAPATNYLTLDASHDLSLAPVAGSPLGVFNHFIRVSLVEYPSVFLDLPFTVEITSCTVTAFFADSPNVSDPPKSREDLLQHITYVIGVDLVKEFPFSFDDIETLSGDGCEAAFIRTYTILVDGSAVSPDWIVEVDPQRSSMRVQSLDAPHEGTYSVEVSASLNTVPAEQFASTKVVFELQISVDECYNVQLVP